MDTPFVPTYPVNLDRELSTSQICLNLPLPLHRTKLGSWFQLVQKLKKQLESQQDVLKQYEPRLKKKEKECKEITKVSQFS